MLNIRWFWINSFKEQIFLAGKWYSTFLFGVFKFPTAQKAIAPLKCKLVLHIHNVFSRINSLPVSQSSRPRPFTFHAFSMLKNSQQQTLFPSHWQWRNFCSRRRRHPLSSTSPLCRCFFFFFFNATLGLLWKLKSVYSPSVCNNKCIPHTHYVLLP